MRSKTQYLIKLRRNQFYFFATIPQVIIAACTKIRPLGHSKRKNVFFQNELGSSLFVTVYSVRIAKIFKSSASESNTILQFFPNFL